MGVGAAGRGDGEPKLETDWWLRGLWYREGSSCSTRVLAAGPFIARRHDCHIN